MRSDPKRERERASARERERSFERKIELEFFELNENREQDGGNKNNG